MLDGKSRNGTGLCSDVGVDAFYNIPRLTREGSSDRW